MIVADEDTIQRAISKSGHLIKQTPLVVSQVERRRRDGVVELSAVVEGFRLWFRFPQILEVELRADPLVACLLIPAMSTGRTLQFADALPVSPQLLDGLETIQSIVNSWNPQFQKISVDVGPATCASDGSAIAAFFSGGVDATFTFLRHINELSYVVYLNGFDFQSDPATLDRAVERNRTFCERFGKELLVVETNYYQFGTRYKVARLSSYGGLLASVALSLGFRQTYVASSLGYLDMPAQGSHPMLDHLWSTEANEIIHDGAETPRTCKLEAIARNNEALANLHVCLSDPNENCGNCSKCVRTMIALAILECESGHFRRKLDLADIRRFPVNSEVGRCFTNDNLQLAIRAGNHTIANILRHQIWKYDARRLVIDVDRIFLGGKMRKMRNQFRRVRPEDTPDIWPAAATN